MLNLRKIFFAHQTAAPADEQPETPRDTIVREDFTWDIDNLTVEQLIANLRTWTVDFSSREGTTWAITDFDYQGVEIRCKLTEAQDIVYAVNGESVFHPRAAVNLVQAALQF